MKLQTTILMTMTIGSFLMTGTSALPGTDGLVLDESYLEDPNSFAGTDERTEYEFKLAFTSHDLPLKNVAAVIEKSILEDKTGNEFLLERMLRGRLNTLDTFETFAFRDIYLDTTNFDLVKTRSAYRLRHRWSRFGLYVRHKIFPFLGAYFPNRAEIQFKTDYQSQGDNLMLASETRFEFRNESHPFNLRNNAPPAPWPEEEYLNYAKTGTFQKYKLKPTVAATRTILPGRTSVEFQPVFKVITARRRSHVNLRNPWGRPPNPDQLFIITVDRSTVEKIYPAFEGILSNENIGEGVFMEIEIELDRSTYTSMLEISKLDALARTPLEAYGIEYTKSVLKGLEADLAEVRRRVKVGLERELGVKFLDVDYKYSRLVKHLMKNKTTLVH